MEILQALNSIFPPERVLTRPLDRLAYAHDASYFSLIPQAVVQPQSIAEIQELFRISHRLHVPLTFRAAGTSLCGQASTDGILVDISKHWGSYQVEQGGKTLRAQPGIVGGFLNTILKPYGRRIGPDPASIDACMLGGILSNNSSGMCCGVVENAYHTLHSLTFVLPDGFSLDTAQPNAHEIFESDCSHIANGLLEIRRQILADTELSSRIRSKYAMKNTNGYALNAFLDFQKPLDIFSHLLIGSEGTLAFIAEAVLHTLPDYPKKYTAQLYFPDIRSASSAVFPIRESGARAVEIMDRAALRSVENLPGIPELIKALPPQAAAVLVEYQSEDEASLDVFRHSSQRTLSQLDLLHEAEFTQDPLQQAILWKARKGMFASVGALRQPGTTLLLEDVVFPVQTLAHAIADLQSIFSHYGYDDAIIFGHAKDGNLHFTISQAFTTENDIKRFDGFMHDLVRVVTGKYDGALKGEHGTGRGFAPFIAAEWGEKAVTLMREIKQLIDPQGLLNPKVILDENPLAHVTAVKEMPLTDPLIDQCIECGYCESKCPSRRLTLTPRQRIVLQRAMTRFSQVGGDGGGRSVRAPDALSAVEGERFWHSVVRDWQYAGLDTCAVDGLCAVACPIGINTGDLTKKLRARQTSRLANRIAVWVERNFKTVETLLRAAVRIGHVLDKLTFKTWRLALVGLEKLLRKPLPKWNDSIPGVPQKVRQIRQPGAAVSSLPMGEQFVYFPSCISRTLGLPKNDSSMSLAEAMLAVAGRAGIHLVIPADVEGICCGMPFGSKGYEEANKEMLQRAVEHFYRWSEAGRYPIVIDTSSCAYTLKSAAHTLEGENLRRYRQMTFLDSIELIHDVLLPRLNLNPAAEQVALHPNCSARKMGLQEKMTAIAQKCSHAVTVPNYLDCCATAGDRGFLFPELTASAALLEAKEIASQTVDGCYSSNIPCEIGMSQATGKDFLGIVYLVERASREKMREPGED